MNRSDSAHTTAAPKPTAAPPPPPPPHLGLKVFEDPGEALHQLGAAVLPQRGEVVGEERLDDLLRGWGGVGWVRGVGWGCY